MCFRLQSASLRACCRPCPVKFWFWQFLWCRPSCAVILAVLSSTRFAFIITNARSDLWDLHVCLGVLLSELAYQSP